MKERRRRRRPCRLALALALGSALGSACAEPEPGECPSAVAAAKGVYIECVEALGMTVERLDLSEAGDIDVEFGEGYTAERAELAIRECEPHMEETLVLNLLACESVEIGHAATAEELEAEVERAAAGGFSGAVAIVRDGELLWSGGVGLADREREIPNTTTTAFDCGSIMKVVTGIAVMQLESEGLVSRDTTLGELLPDVPEDKAGITVEQILTHRAGFQEFHDTEGDFEPIDRRAALQRILEQELLFAPGEDEAYSSSGYTLLAIVAEEVSGLPFHEHVRARILEPAMMTRTGVYGDGLWGEGEAAIGYDDGTFGCNSPGCWPAPSWALVGNGGLVSTVEDLSRLSAAIEGEILFDAATRDAFRELVLGARDVSIDGERVWTYSGRNDFGFGAAVAEVPARGTRVVVATNTAASGSDSVLMASLLQMSLGALIELQPPQ
jgi:CubicO group peptidase (beta-lactamase class C family)